MIGRRGVLALPALALIRRPRSRQTLRLAGGVDSWCPGMPVITGTSLNGNALRLGASSLTVLAVDYESGTITIG